MENNNAHFSLISVSAAAQIRIWPHAKAQRAEINFSFLTLSPSRGFVSEFIRVIFWEKFWRETIRSYIAPPSFPPERAAA
jgi:hypothetical protein